MTEKYDRRDFIKYSLLGSALLPMAPYATLAATTESPDADEFDISIFSKHLQFLGYEDLAAVSRDIGFDGVELSVRDGGHVLPENVGKDLPRAVAAVRDAGLHADMIVTGIKELNPLSKKVLETAAAEGVKYYRMGYLRYPKTGTIPEALEHYKGKVEELAEFGRGLGIQCCYQNHNGTSIGSNVWEIWQLLKDTDKEAMGAQYDIYHATVEGGRSWPNGIRLLQNRISNIVLKDFRWEHIDGRWQVYKTPLGEGMVNFDAYFKMLKELGIHVPVAMHFEFDLFGAERGNRDIPEEVRPTIYEAMKKDLELARKWWREA